MSEYPSFIQFIKAGLVLEIPVTFNILYKYIMTYTELDVPLKQGSEYAISYPALSVTGISWGRMQH